VFPEGFEEQPKKGDLSMPTTKKAAAKKPATEKSPVKKATVKKAAKSKVKRTPNAAFMKPMTPTGPLAAVVGAIPLPRTEVVKKVWDYIKKNKLQGTANKRMINADEKLREIFGKAEVSMFEMSKIISQHLK
jgi:chromatin remodeling complex protein RSC6